MKKFFFFAACLMSASMFATAPQVEFVANLGEGDVVTTSDGKQTTILSATDKDTKDTKYNVAAGTTLVSNSKITVKNAFTVDYKNVGMESTDSAYVKMMIGTTEVNFKNSAIQGQSNPSPNPVSGVDTKATPSTGACYIVDVKEDGWLLVAVKATPNKNQFAMENYVSGTTTAANSLEYRYACMTNNTTADSIGNPNGCLQVFFEGNAKSGYILASAKAPYQLYDEYTNTSAYGKNGPGFMLVEVYKAGSPYLVGTAGSKMMAAGFAWISDTTDLNITVIGSTEKGKSNVTLWPYGANAKTQDCGTKENTFNLKFTAPAEWVADTLDTKNGESFKKVYAKVTDVVNGTKNYEMGVLAKDTIQGRIYAKDGIYTLAYKTKALTFDVEFAITAQEGATYPVATEAATGLTADACFTAGQVADNKFTLQACETALEDVKIEAMDNKFIMNGHLYLKKNGRVYNAAGAMVK